MNYKRTENRKNLLLALLLCCLTPLLESCGGPIAQPWPDAVPPAPIGPESGVFPLAKRIGTRCLVDQAGKPFVFQGEAAWSLLVQLKREDVELYLEDRRRRGFNTLLVNLIEHKFSERAPRNAYGEAPFLAPGDYARPNERYFAHVDWVLGRAAERGFLVLLAPSYLGNAGGSEGWYSEMQDTGVERLRAYGRYLGIRYRNMPNIIWMEGGDYNAPDLQLVDAIAEGLRNANSATLQSFHAARGTSARKFLGNRHSWLDLNTVYTDENGVVRDALGEYYDSTLPFILVEGRYEGEGANEATIRRQAYQAVLSGSCGQVYGNKPVWRFDSGWKDALDSPGARSMMQLRHMLDTIHWWQMRPIQAGFFLQGLGEKGTQLAASISTDRRTAVVYVPSARAMILDYMHLTGSTVTLRWIDPANRYSFEQPGSPFAISKRQVLYPPGPNSRGFGDWLLFVETDKSTPGKSSIFRQNPAGH